MVTEITIAVASEDRTSWKEAGENLLGEWKCSRNVPYLDSTVFSRVSLFVKTHQTVCFRPVHFTGRNLHLDKKRRS